MTDSIAKDHLMSMLCAYECRWRLFSFGSSVQRQESLYNLFCFRKLKNFNSLGFSFVISYTIH